MLTFSFHDLDLILTFNVYILIKSLFYIGVLGLHSMMNQEQYHSAQSEKWSDKPDPATGWSGVTKATPLKEFPPEGTFDSLISRYILF